MDQRADKGEANEILLQKERNENPWVYPECYLAVPRPRLTSV